MVAVRSDVLCMLLCFGWTIGMECCKSRHNTQQKILPIHSLTKLSQYVCLRSFWTCSFIISCNNEEQIVMEFSSLFALWSGSIMFSLIYRVCRSGVLDKKRFHYILHIRYMTRRRVYVSHRELDICWFHHFHVPLGPSRICLGGGARWGEVSFLRSWGR